jgi:outer membrane protein assembly factor BamB
MSRLLRGRRWLPWLAAVGLLLVVAGSAFAYLAIREGDVSNPDVEFVETAEAPVAPEPEPRAAARHPADDGFSWPNYGLTKARTHALSLTRTLRPPFDQAWAVRGSVLLEFTPVLCGRRLFLLKNNGALYAISRTTGEVTWKRKIGSLAASSPACGDGRVYAVLLEDGERRGRGSVVALDAADGRIRWRRPLPSRAESSPLLDGERLYFGSENGTVYAVRTGDGAVRWRFRAEGAVKGAVALADGKLYFGDYGGRVYAIRQRDGSQVWRTGTSGRALGLAAGNFYSSPAVAYGRVYLGNTDGYVYSFSSRDGELAWRTRTGGYVYASPAVTTPTGGGPTVYIGSYDGTFYALDARSGDRRWTRRLGRKISGAATVIGDLVFVSDLDLKTSWALGVNTGATVWKTGRGAFNAAISDGRRVYFNGYSSLFGLDPQGIDFDGSSARRAQARREGRRARSGERRREGRRGRSGERRREGRRARSGERRREGRAERRPSRRDAPR